MSQQDGADTAKLLEASRALIDDRELDEAERLLRKAIGRAPDNPETFNLFGVVRELRGEKLEAEKYYRAALLFGTYPPARRNLERLVIEARKGEIDVGVDDESGAERNADKRPDRDDEGV